MDGILGGERMKLEHRCKICKSPEWVYRGMILYRVKGWSYEQIIEHFSQYIDNLNVYNLSIHFRNHCQQRDFDAAKAKLEEWEKMDAQFRS